MASSTASRDTRDRILDAATEVLTRRGLARATTKEIARAAGCSEALLYKHFGDKQEIFLAVLAERLPRFDAAGSDENEHLEERLTSLVDGLLRFYLASFPIAASIFGSDELLAAHRDRVDALGGGPEAPAARLQRLLEDERRRGRVSETADTEVAARTLAGAAFFEAFLRTYRGGGEIPERSQSARRIVRTVLPSLEPPELKDPGA
jgi:AcrR family transcriptional regulator